MALIEQKAAFACTVAQEKAPESICGEAFLQNKVSQELYFFWKFLDFSSLSMPKGRFPEPKPTCSLEVSAAKKKWLQVF